jgi:hypothetical protein
MTAYVALRPIAFDLADRAVGVAVLAVTDCSCVVNEAGLGVQGQLRFGYRIFKIRGQQHD